MSSQREEDVGQNPFMQALRSSFEHIYERAAKRGEATTLIVPCSECLDGEVTSAFAETHILIASHVPGHFTNLLGQGVVIKGSSASTDLGFTESRTCEILQTEMMYDYGNTFRVLVTDKPLHGKYKIIPGLADRAPKGVVTASLNLSAGHESQDWLNSAPAISDNFFDQVDRFRKTFVQVPGCETSTAERIGEMVEDAKKRLIKHHKLSSKNQQRELEYQVSRNAYAALQSFLFPHLVRMLVVPEEKLQKAIRSYATAADLLTSLDANLLLANVDIRSCAEKLADIDHKISPHEKMECLVEVQQALPKLVAKARTSSPRPSPRGEGSIEITGDDTIALFILAVYKSNLPNCLAHVAHVEMYSQGESACIQEAGYAIATLGNALKFFYDDRRHVTSRSNSTAARAGPKKTDVFKNFVHSGSDLTASFGAEDDLTGLVRHARNTQGQVQR